jgi:hypothetical protein
MITNTKVPDYYLHIREGRTGEEWIMPLRRNSLLDLKHQIKKWIKREFCGELMLDGEIMPKIEGDYFAQIKTDGRPPDSIVCWTSGGFFIKLAY